MTEQTHTIKKILWNAEHIKKIQGMDTCLCDRNI
jgi:hypothetical protein